MKRIAALGLVLLALTGCNVKLGGQSSWSTVIDSQSSGSHIRLVIDKPAIRATPNGSTTTAAYMTIHNEGNQPDRLMSASCDCAAKATLHTTMTTGDMSTGGMMMMQEMTDGFAIAPGETLVFKPGGNHLMLEGLKKPLADSGVQSVNLTFAKAGTVAVAMPVLTSPGSDAGK